MPGRKIPAEGYRTYSVRVSAATYARIEQLAQQEKRSINAELNVLIELGLKHTRRRRGEPALAGEPEGDEDAE